MVLVCVFLMNNNIAFIFHLTKTVSVVKLENIKRKDTQFDLIFIKTQNLEDVVQNVESSCYILF